MFGNLIFDPSNNQVFCEDLLLLQSGFLVFLFVKLFHMENAEFDIALFVLNRDAMLQKIRQSYPTHSTPQSEMHRRDQELRNCNTRWHHPTRFGQSLKNLSEPAMKRWTLG